MISIQEVRSSIIFDFEGVGISRASKTAPRPHMVGIFLPNNTGGSGKYKWTAFSESWGPATNGSKKPADTRNFSDFFLKHSLNMRERGGRLIHWSPHEAEILRIYLSTADLEVVEPLLYNVRIPAKKYLRRVKRLSSKGKSLEDFFSAMYQKRKPFPALKIGAAESCRRIDSACAKNKKWGRFTTTQREYVHDLIAYNEGDCRATWLIAKRLANSAAD